MRINKKNKEIKIKKNDNKDKENNKEDKEIVIEIDRDKDKEIDQVIGIISIVVNIKIVQVEKKVIKLVNLVQDLLK